jgi:hypothetical protein
MYPDVRQRLVNSGVEVPTEGTVTLYHATRSERLVEIERTLVVPATVDDDGRRRVYVASDAAIAEVIPHAEGAVAIEVDVALDLEFGMGDSPDKDWVELVYEVPDTEEGLPVASARRV